MLNIRVHEQRTTNPHGGQTMKVDQQIRKGTVAIVYDAYDQETEGVNRVVSQHRTMDAAQRKAKGAPAWGVVDVRDIGN